jgi:hypothetical protein
MVGKAEEMVLENLVMIKKQVKQHTILRRRVTIAVGVIRLIHRPFEAECLLQQR